MKRGRTEAAISRATFAEPEIARSRDRRAVLPTKHHLYLANSLTGHPRHFESQPVVFHDVANLRRPAEALKLTESIAHDPTQWEAQLVAGSAAMALERPAEAAAFFKAIVDRRTKLGINICIPIALNKLARAQAAVGDKAAARATYEELFKLWQRADADVPLLVEAKKQYAALSS